MENHIVVTTIRDKRSGKDHICLSDLLLMLHKELNHQYKGDKVYLYIEDLIFRLENMKDLKGK
jgi:hypothetical protein